jgi:hypothetical protein
MANKVAIVSASNDGYFYLLDGLIASLEDADLSGDFDLCVYDVGLTNPQVQNLVSRHVTVVAPPWSIEFPNQRQAPGWFRAMTNRPRLPWEFPGYETYVWIDADCWIQHAEGIYAAVESARQGSIALVAERFERSIVYPKMDDFGRFQDRRVDEASCRRNLAVCYRNCFGKENEYRAQQTVINSGFFALRGDSPIWDRWLHYIRQGLSRAFHVLVEQQALNLAILEGGIAATMLSIRYNWNLACMEPLYDRTAGKLVAPSERKPLGLIHLHDLKHLYFIEVPDLNGQMVRLQLRYRDFTRPGVGRPPDRSVAGS